MSLLIKGCCAVISKYSKFVTVGNNTTRTIHHAAGSQSAASVTPSSTPEQSEGDGGSDKAAKISKAMKAYLERAKAQDKFMREEQAEFEIGKRHLARIMGADPDMFTQEDIDEAIAYLLPSGLFDKKARPMLKPAEQVLPKRKAVQFGLDGRPFSSFFYTCKPKYYGLIHELCVQLEQLKVSQDEMLSRGETPDTTTPHQMLSGSQWLDKKQLEDRFQEKLSDDECSTLLVLAERVAHHFCPQSDQQLVMQLRRPLVSTNVTQDILPLKLDANGRGYQEAEGRRKRARAFVRLFQNGTGKVTINGRSLLEQFPRILDREQIMFPLHFADRLCQVDFEARVEAGGMSGQAGALRHALSQALQSMVEPSMVQKMRLAGLLTKDPRRLERQKPGQHGARRKYTWLKR